MSRTYLVCIATLIVWASHCVVASDDLDPETKNHYKASDLGTFLEAKEWIIFSLEPIAATLAEGGDPFADPPKDAIEKEKIQPKPPVDPDQLFHDYPILGQTKVVVTPELKTVITTLDEAGRHWGGAVAMCFSPRHGIRVIKGGKPYDLVICYECMAADLYAGDERVGSVFFATEAGLLPRPAYLNGALLRAKVKLPPPPHH